MLSESTNRKRAYEYMVKQAKRIHWIPPINSDKQLADTLDIPLNELTALKEGLADPSSRLVKAFKNLVAPMVSEPEVGSYLVEPFKRQQKLER